MSIRKKKYFKLNSALYVSEALGKLLLLGNDPDNWYLLPDDTAAIVAGVGIGWIIGKIRLESVHL